ncbi:hypothetical protein A5821_002185 [Enterococcus sp. 7F3_DIV0205]|uniref:DUF5067 domain-containing protein n=1 Tax=Candidatus Enterococcus palustris TaxID=1834189 RepID=A0AAQ3Y7H5_9ENTE|nr:DUF5067 domain-containing protein [Enterococcus sp. 7F3_DIV0205]OTN82624.1 hypothetical protein A5821_002535 [Enterococcus sp. 7F3_DIV0205]
MKKRKAFYLAIIVVVFFLSGCGQSLDKKKQAFTDRGISYELQLPSGWKVDKGTNDEYSLHTPFSAEDTKSNSYLFIITAPVMEVDRKEFGEQTREKLKERYKYKKAKDIYMKELKINNNPAYKYTLNTIYNEKSVWAHFYYIWTEHGFVQLTFYSADDNSYKKRSEIIDASVGTFKEVSYDKENAEKDEEEQKKEEGDVITIENDEIKMETTAVRQLTGANHKKLLAIRYTFTNLSTKPMQPSVWKDLVTAKQNDKALSFGSLPEGTSLLDVKDLMSTQTKEVKEGESVESVVLYELSDQSTVELSFSQEAFSGQGPTRVVVPK